MTGPSSLPAQQMVSARSNQTEFRSRVLSALRWQASVRRPSVSRKGTSSVASDRASARSHRSSSQSAAAWGRWLVPEAPPRPMQVAKRGAKARFSMRDSRRPRCTGRDGRQHDCRTSGPPRQWSRRFLSRSNSFGESPSRLRPEKLRGAGPFLDLTLPSKPSRHGDPAAVVAADWRKPICR